MSLIAVIEIRRRSWEDTGEVAGDEVVEIRRVEGDEVALANAGGVAVTLVLRAVSADGIVLDQAGVTLELAIGDRTRVALPDAAIPTTWELRVVTIRSVDARTMPGGTELERDLLAAIRTAPDDDPPRLVYADWLLSQPAQGDRDRGELVQVQCALAASPPAEQRRMLRARERELLAALPPPSFGPGVDLQLVWERGFLERCHGSLEQLARSAVEVFQLAPMLSVLDLEAVNVSNQSLLWRLGTIEQVEQIRDLAVAPRAGVTLGGGFGDTVLVTLAPRLAGLRRLRLSAMRIGEAGVTSLVEARCCAQLASLDLTGNALAGGALRALAASTRLQPAVVRLAGCDLQGYETELLAGAQWLAEVVELDLGDNALRDPGALVLARVPFRGLRRLALASCGIGPDATKALVRSKHLARLAHLRLHRNAIGDAGAIALARSRLRSIEDLDLQGCAIGDAGAIALADSANARPARRWRLGGNRIGDAGARAIAESVYLRDLASLELVHCPIGDAGAAALIASALPAVTLSADLLSEEMRDRVRERFGTAALTG